MKQLVLLTIGALALLLGATLAGFEGHGALAVIALLGAVVLSLMLWRGAEAYRSYELTPNRSDNSRPLRLISRNATLAKLLKQKLRSGEVARVGNRLYYRSQGRRTRRSPWSRLWSIELVDIPSLRINEGQWVPALVLWPGPFRGGILFRPRDKASVYVKRTGEATYSLQPNPLPRREWFRLRISTSQQLERLSLILARVIGDLEDVTNQARIGNRYRVTLRLGR